jgi:hypothetical protein
VKEWAFLVVNDAKNHRKGRNQERYRNQKNDGNSGSQRKDINHRHQVNHGNSENEAKSTSFSLFYKGRQETRTFFSDNTKYHTNYKLKELLKLKFQLQQLLCCGG